MERLKLLLKYQRDFFFVGFLFLGAIAIITWAIGFFQYGIALAGTLPILPYYSPHKYNVIAYSLFYLLFYDRRFKNLAFPYFMLCYLAQESIDNVFTTIPQLLTTSGFGFSRQPPFNGGILWIFISLALGGSILLFSWLRPELRMNHYWKWVVIGIWLWIDRSYLGSIVSATPMYSWPGYVLEICRNCSYQFMIMAVVYNECRVKKSCHSCHSDFE